MPNTPSSIRHAPDTLAMAVAGLLALPLWWWLGDVCALPASRQPLAYLTLHTLLWFDFTAFLLFAGVFDSSQKQGLSRAEWILAIVVAVTAAALAMRGEPLLETDPYRYLYDGRQLLQGVNPFLEAPVHLGDSVGRPWYFQKINHPELATIYPPLAQFFFWLSALLALDSLLAWKILVTLLGFASIALIAAALKNLGRDPRLVLFLLLNPLWIKEISNSGHMDVAMLLPLSAACWALTLKKEKTTALAFGLSMLGKWTSLALAPAFFLGMKRRRWFALAPLAVFAGLLPFLLWERWTAPFETLATFSKDWIFHAFVYDIITKSLEWTGASWGTSAMAGKVVSAGVLGSFTLYLWKRVHSPAQALAGAYWLAVLMLLCSQAIFPWYVTLALMLAPFAGSLRAAWIWTLLAPLSYTYYIAWQPVVWVKYLSFAILCWVLWKDWGFQRAGWTSSLPGGTKGR